MNALLRLKRFVTALIAAVMTFLVYRYLIGNLLSSGLSKLWLILLWLFTAYLVLPQLHRLLVRVYVPSYFIGRTRTGDGLLGDPVNLAIVGNRTALVKTMRDAGWELAEELDAKTSWKMFKSTILKRSYPTAPVSSLFLFGQKQSLAFQQEVDGDTFRRHHVRFWETPKKWWLPGGYQADWLGAATYDKGIGFSAFTLQFTHKIEENIDIERDYVVSTMKKSGYVDHIDYVKHYASGYHSRNGGGDNIRTDGDLPFIHLRQPKQS